MMPTPDELQAEIYENEIAGRMRPGSALAFAHGLNVHFDLIVPASDVDVLMIAPKGPGHTVRGEYQKGAAYLVFWQYIRTLLAMPMTLVLVMRLPLVAAVQV